MDSSTLPPIIPDFKDRRGGLIAFGIVTVIVGCVCALFVPMMFFGKLVSAHKTNIGLSYRGLVPAAIMYGTAAVVFVWLGLGSMRARRWARALLLILSWYWLVGGVIGVAAMMWFMPTMLAHLQTGMPAAPSVALMVTMIVMLVPLSLFFIFLPGGLILFYRSPHVKATCEARDPVPGWTDACPLPVLASSLMLAFGAVMMLTMSVCYNGVIPFFGQLLSGWTGSVVCLLMIALWCYCAWAMYRLKPLGWVVTVIGTGVMGVSAIITFAQVDLIEMYRLMGYPEEQIKLIQQSGMLGTPLMRLLMTVAWLPMLGFLLYVKKFFRRTG